MLSDVEREALLKWYGRQAVLGRARELIEERNYHELEELVHMISLFPLSRHSELPDYMRDAEGGPLFPTNLNPRADEEKWQDAIEVGWEVMQQQFGLDLAEVERRLGEMEKSDWDDFIASVEQRKRERGMK